MEFLGAPMSPAESDAAIARIEKHLNDHGFSWMAIQSRESGVFIGAIGPAVVPFDAHFTPCVEIGWRLAFDHWGQGFATEAAREVLRYCVDTLKLSEVVAFAVTSNIRSRRVMEKCGMTYDPSGDFDHPNLPEGHSLRRHVLYRYDVAQAFVPAGPELIPAPAVSPIEL
jgi:RimJ/RimL family protein N-acetyltransferase